MLEEKIKFLKRIKFLLIPVGLAALVSGVGLFLFVFSGTRRYGGTPILKLPLDIQQKAFWSLLVFPIVLGLSMWEGSRRAKRFAEWAMGEHLEFTHELRGNVDLFALQGKLEGKEKRSEKEQRILEYLNSQLNASDIEISSN